MQFCLIFQNKEDKNLVWALCSKYCGCTQAGMRVVETGSGALRGLLTDPSQPLFIIHGHPNENTSSIISKNFGMRDGMPVQLQKGHRPQRTTKQHCKHDNQCSSIFHFTEHQNQKDTPVSRLKNCTKCLRRSVAVYDIGQTMCAKNLLTMPQILTPHICTDICSDTHSHTCTCTASPPRIQPPPQPTPTHTPTLHTPKQTQTLTRPIPTGQFQSHRPTPRSFRC